MRKNNVKYVLTILFFVFVNICEGQTVQHSWSVRVGYLYSKPSLTKNSVYIPLNLAGIRPIDGYYLGICNEISWKRIGLRTELNYQRKGMTGVDVRMTPEVRVNSYNYVGITPTLSYNPFKKLYIYTGPELNLLLAKNSVFVHSNDLELGVAYRLGYRLKHVEISAGGTSGLTPYAYSISGGARVFSYLNSNWQFGLVYNLRL